MSEILLNYVNEFRSGRDLIDCDTTPFFDALVATNDESLLSNLLVLWEEKGVTENELFNLASLMRSRMKRIVHDYACVVDIVGTGGSRIKTFNVSTAAVFVVAGAGVPVAKHGNRAATSSSGSADVLDLLGVRSDVSPEIAEACLNEIGICFMFAPKYHQLSSVLGKVRRELRRPCVFNNLGPLCNPAAAQHQLIGVWDERLVEKTANVLRRLGTRRSWVVHAKTGLDEIARRGETIVGDVNTKGVKITSISVKDFGSFNAHGPVPDTLDAEQSARLIRRILENKQRGSNSERLVVLNAAAAIFISGTTESLPEAFVIATESIASGKALEKLNLLAEATNK